MAGVASFRIGVVSTTSHERPGDSAPTPLGDDVWRAPNLAKMTRESSNDLVWSVPATTSVTGMVATPR
jgi:hypothetical protein